MPEYQITGEQGTNRIVAPNLATAIAVAEPGDTVVLVDDRADWPLQQWRSRAVVFKAAFFEMLLRVPSTDAGSSHLWERIDQIAGTEGSPYGDITRRMNLITQFVRNHPDIGLILNLLMTDQGYTEQEATELLDRIFAAAMAHEKNFSDDAVNAILDGTQSFL